MSQFLQQPIILLADGTDDQQGVSQILSNIEACLSIVDIVKTTLGPNGMDKLILRGKNATISNDGATVVSLLDVEHPAAKALVDIAQSQDAEVGDGTTSVMVLAGAFMNAAQQFLLDGVHPRLIIKSFRKATSLAIHKINDLAVDISQKTAEEKRDILCKMAATSLSSKLIGGIKKQFFSDMVVDAVLALDEDLDIEMVGVKKCPGGSMEDSFLVKGVAFLKTFSYAGFEQQPKTFENPKVLCLKHELELKAEVDSAEVRVDKPEEYQAIVDAEWEIIYDKLSKIEKSGAKIVLSTLAIGDLATQYFADRGIFCAGRVKEDDMDRVCKATGAQTQTTVNNLIPEILGTCGHFEEKQVGGERYNFFTECPQAKTATILLRGGAEQFIAEAERSLHDAIMIVRRALKNTSIVAGGGAIDMILSTHIRDFAKSIKGKEQLMIAAYAKALENIPKQLAENAGFDSTDIMTKLRHHHALNKNSWYGVNVVKEGICNTMDSFVWEPSMVKKNAILSASEACCLILSIDETIKNPQSEQDAHENMRNKGRGRFF